MFKRYRCVSSKDKTVASEKDSTRMEILAASDLFQWIARTDQKISNDGTIVATFIIDINETLWVADRHSEHYSCAKGDEVLSAGELTLLVEGDGISVIEITNQSTGYCPEPASWPNVQQALIKTNIAFPNSFTSEFIFRRCDSCRALNIVKEEYYQCAICDAALNLVWNCDANNNI